ncbi:polysaccharide pyruvyl transferase WcaK-like protein [Marinobacter pelagius]|uniref:Polysaccharide pyruvyl transferase WcaK-like protein n=1 Tax=Marinobacter pelagius TaxID=379482 RepID=A0A366G058_9GAMM|nr:polysaccharide pyruvyl transferase family protein [Marinobacter pelagius]RBP20318.1 polysaccharide pyruvyl transferase WcaK-like protein [Marinobacter pelagius]
MKVAIFGSYNGGSIGDTAILLGLVSSIFRVSEKDVEVTVLALGSVGINEELKALGVTERVKEVPVNRRFSDLAFGIGEYLDKSWRYFKRLRGEPPLNKGRIRRVLRDSDVLLVGGGNLVMDLYENWPRILRSVCDVSKELNVPYCFVGVGSAPINTLKGKRDLFASLKFANGVFFRDLASKEYCEKNLGFDKSSVGPDLAFGIDCPELTKAEKKDALLLNLAAVYSDRWPVKDPDKYDKYLSSMVELVDRLVEKLAIKEVVIFNTNYPLDEFAAEDFVKKYENCSYAPVSLSFIRGRNTVSQLLTICSSARFSLVTRLHAGILSKISGAYVFAVEYQPKVRDVLHNQTSGTMVESFDSVLSGKAFQSINQDFSAGEREENFVGRDEVDKLVRQVVKQCKPQVV